jgi:hypothetical protein
VRLKYFSYLTAAVFIAVIFTAGCTKPIDNGKEGDIKATVKGTVSAPLEKAVVYVYKAGMDLRGPPFVSIETSELMGEFSVDLPAGEYFFVARKRVSKEAIGPVVPGDYKSETIGPIKIAKGGEINIDLMALRKLGDVKEDIAADEKTDTSFSGAILDSDGEPIDGIRVHAYDHIQMSERPKFVSEKTGPDGKYKIYIPEGGTYYICARDKFGGPPKVGDLYGRYDQGAIDPSAVMVETGNHLTDVDITVHKVW